MTGAEVNDGRRRGGGRVVIGQQEGAEAPNLFWQTTPRPKAKKTQKTRALTLQSPATHVDPSGATQASQPSGLLLLELSFPLLVNSPYPYVVFCTRLHTLTHRHHTGYSFEQVRSFSLVIRDHSCIANRPFPSFSQNLPLRHRSVVLRRTL